MTNHPYGKEHKAVRQGWVPVVATGLVACARCGNTIRPDLGDLWELDHDNLEMGTYRGPSHAPCNKISGDAYHRVLRDRDRRAAVGYSVPVEDL